MKPGRTERSNVSFGNLSKRIHRALVGALVIFGVIAYAPPPVFATTPTPPSILSPGFAYQDTTPTVDGSSGALTESISIDIPPGRNELHPSLSLDYSSQDTANDSEVGYGWALSIPYIQRLNKTGSENLYSSNAYFTSSLDGELATTSVGTATSTATSTIANNLLSYWKLDESSGNAADSVGTNTLTNHNTVSFGAASGKINNGANFNGTSQYLDNTSITGLTLGTSTFTVGFWIDILGNGTTGSNGRIFSLSNSSHTSLVDFEYDTSSNILYLYWSDGPNGAEARTTCPAINGWHYIVGERTATSSAVIYVDGTLANTNFSTFGTPSNTNLTGISAVSLGKDLTSNAYLSGDLDEVGIWSRALSSSEISQLYNAGTGLAYPFATSTTPSYTYLPRVDDGSFDNYSYSTSTDSWTMYDKKGDEYLFGASAQSQESATTTQTDTVQSFKWMLEKEIDPNGNYIRYTYSKDHNQLYPQEIVYTGQGSSDGPMTVTFATTTRTDTGMNNLPGFEVDTNYLISQITVAVSSSTVRQYNLSYTPGNNGYRSLLSSVQEEGWNTSGTQTTLPPWTFGYVSSSTSFVSSYGSGGGPINSDGDFEVAADANGDGVSEQVDLNCTAVSSEGIVITPSTGSPTPPQVNGLCWSYGVDQAFETGTRFIDLNGDGKADIFQSESGSGANAQHAYLTSYATSTGYGWASTTLSGTIPSVALTSVGSASITTGLFGDVNGTGLPSFTQRIDGQLPATAYIANGSGWDATTDMFTPPTSFPSFGSADCTNAQLVDVNGDGLPDWVYSDNSHINVILNTGLGWGSADPRWTISTSSVYQSGGNCYDRGVRFVDINGDGLPDLIRSFSNTGNTSFPENGTYQYVYLNTGHGWATSTAYTLPTYIDDEYNITGTNEVQYADYANFLGNGQQDQDVLSTSTNPKGGITTATYGYTTESGSNPYLPYNLLVVTKVVNDDGRGNKQETDYTYTGGLQYLPSNVYDRKFAGFAAVTASTSVALSTTYYSQGSTTTAAVAGDQSDGYGQLNLPYRKDTATPSGTLLQSTFYQYNGIFHGNSEFVGLVRQLEQDYAADGTHRDKDTEYTYSTSTDDLTQSIAYGEVSGNSNGTFSTSTASTPRTTDITYAASSSINLSVPVEQTLFNSAGATTTDTKYFYDGLSFGHAGLGNRTQEQDWISGSRYASSTATYNAYGLIATSTDRNGNATHYVYDAFNLDPATTTNALGQSTTAAYNYSNGKVATSTDPNGDITVNKYDGVGRVIEIDESDPSSPTSVITKSTYVYTDSTSSPSSIHEADYLNSASTTDTYDYYDGLDRMIQERKSTETSGTFAVTDRTYNFAGLLASQSFPYFASGSGNAPATTTSSLFTSYFYDPLQRTATTTNAVGTTISVYGKWTTTTTDPNRDIEDYTLDAFGNLAQVVEHNTYSSATTTYAYDAANNLATTTDATGNIRTFAYDGLSRRVSATDLHTTGAGSYGTWTYSYDDQGNETSRTDPKSQTVTHAYDALNRMLTESWTGHGTQISDTYDSCTNGVGYVCTASTSAAVDTYAYDVLGRPTGATTTTQGTSYGLAYGYDRQGDITSVMNNADGSQVSYTYNPAGLVSAVARTSGGATSSIATLSSFSPLDQLGKVAFGSGASTTYSYAQTSLYRLSNILTLGALTGSGTTTHDYQLQNLSFTYDADGNILSRSDASDEVQGQTLSYTYDALNRLLTASSTGGVGVPVYSQTYTYDALGNITSRIDATTTLVGQIAYDNALQYDSGSGSSITESYTTGSSTTNRLMVVEAIANPSGSTSNISSMAYNGASLTKLTSLPFNTVSSPTNVVDIWYLLNPAGGTHNLTINYSPGSNFGFDIVTYSGASQSSFPQTSTSSAQDSGTTFSLSLCSSGCAANSWAAIFVNSQRNVTAGANVTSRIGNSTGLFAGDNNGSLSGPITMTTNISSSNATAGELVSIAPAGSGTAGTTTTYTYGSSGFPDPDAPTTIANGLSTSTLTYDNNGNLTQVATGLSTTTYAYDYLNRLATSTVAGVTTTYGYDAFGNRVSQSSGSTVTVYPSKWYSVTTTTNGATSTATSTEYVFDPAQAGSTDVLLATVDTPSVNGVAGSSTTRYVHTDNLGSTQVTSDQNGNLAQWFDYAPYGSVLGSTNTGSTTAARQYIGQYFDPSSNLSYLQNRYYSPTQGQFTTQDPLFLAIGNPTEITKLTQHAQEQLLMKPQQLNSYSYGGDNPLTLKDPLGLEAQIFSDNPVVATLEYFGYLSTLKDVYDYSRSGENSNSGGGHNPNVSNSTPAHNAGDQVEFDTILTTAGFLGTKTEALGLTLAGTGLQAIDWYCSSFTCENFSYTQSQSPQDIVSEVINPSTSVQLNNEYINTYTANAASQHIQYSGEAQSSNQSRNYSAFVGLFNPFIPHNSGSAIFNSGNNNNK